MICICFNTKETDIERVTAIAHALPCKVEFLDTADTNAQEVLQEGFIFYILSDDSELKKVSGKNGIAIMPYETALKGLSGFNYDIPLITYGISARATLSYSSNSREGLLISLQRSIKAVSGKTVEPQEIPVSLNSGESADDKLIETAIKLMLE